MKVTRPKNADYDGLKKILTILRKNVFSYVDIEVTGVAGSLAGDSYKFHKFG
jgi:hypothetical protein